MEFVVTSKKKQPIAMRITDPFVHCIVGARIPLPVYVDRQLHVAFAESRNPFQRVIGREPVLDDNLKVCEGLLADTLQTSLDRLTGVECGIMMDSAGISSTNQVLSKDRGWFFQRRS